MSMYFVLIDEHDQVCPLLIHVEVLKETTMFEHVWEVSHFDILKKLKGFNPFSRTLNFNKNILFIYDIIF